MVRDELGQTNTQTNTEKQADSTVWRASKNWENHIRADHGWITSRERERDEAAWIHKKTWWGEKKDGEAIECSMNCSHKHTHTHIKPYQLLSLSSPSCVLEHCVLNLWRVQLPYFPNTHINTHMYIYILTTTSCSWKPPCMCITCWNDFIQESVQMWWESRCFIKTWMEIVITDQLSYRV